MYLARTGIISSQKMHYKTITVDHTKVPNTDQTNFPVFISGTYPYLSHHTYGGNVRDLNGYDIEFYSNSTLTTKLDWELVKYVASTGQLIAFVRVPTLTTATDYVFYMRYGDPTKTTFQGNVANTYNSNFKGIWRLNDNAANTTVRDVLGLNNATNNANTSTKTTAGKVDTGLTYNGSSDQSTMASNVGAYVLADSFTISAWVNITANSTNQAIFGNTWSHKGYLLRLANNNRIRMITVSDDVGGTYSGRDSSVLTSGWYYVAGVWRGSGIPDVYINGVLDNAVNVTAGTMTTITNAYTTRIGNTPDGTNNYFNGVINEVRSIKAGLSADWLKTDYNNQSSPSTFYTIS